MSTLGLPYYFEDTTGLPCGPTDFLDIYDRPPFLRLSTSTSQSHSHSRSPTKNTSALYGKSRPTAPTAPDPTSEARTLKIYELSARTFTTARSPPSHHPQRQHHREDGSSHTQTPSAVLSLDEGHGIVGSIKFRGGTGVALERWLKKSNTFGSTLTRQFRASDGMYYQWSFRSVQDHEWACVQLGTNRVVAHYDVHSSTEPTRTYHQTSRNVFTVQEGCVHLSVEFLASLIIMRHIRARSSY